MKDNKDENLVVIAQTGMGKTEASLLWLGNNKGFFNLPIRMTINEIYKRLRKIVNNKNIDKRIALLHGETKSYYYENLNDIELGGDREEYITKTRQLSLPVTVCTLDQLFTIVFKYRNYEQVLATLSYSKVIIDEIQMYGPNLIGYLISGLKMIQDVGGKFAVVTATFPGFLKKIMEDEGLKFKMSDKPFVEETMVRHSVEWKEENINAEFILEKYSNNRVLVICNTVKECQKLYNEIKKEVEDVNLFHSKFIKKDRKKKEESIVDFGKLYKDDGTKSNDSGIWIATSVAEASLDIDFDILITELSDVNSLFQRFGRCFRKRIWECIGYNCYVFDGGDNKCTGVGGIIDEEIFNLSKINLRRFFKNHIPEINEIEKMDLVESIYSYENVENTKYYKKIQNFMEATDLYLAGEIGKDESQNKFREILSITIIPSNVYRDNEEEIMEYLEVLNSKNSSIESRIKARENLYDFTLNISMEEKIKSYPTTEILKIGKYEKIEVVYSEYDSEIGIRSKK